MRIYHAIRAALPVIPPAAIALISLMSIANRTSAAVYGEPIILNSNGAWSWFEDERVVIDQTAGKLLLSSVGYSSGSGGAARDGDVDIVAYDLNTEQVDLFVLHDNLQADDHNSAAIFVRPDGRYLAAYSRHNSDQTTRFRISTNPGDLNAWGAEFTFNNGAGTTYNNLHRLSAEGGRIYNFTRTVGFDPNFQISDNDGATWSYGGRLLDGPGRPYLKYASNGVDEIHFINTEEHPRNFDNSIYHGFIRGGEVFNSFGTKIDDLDASGMSPTAGTRIFQGNADNVGWTSDIHLDSAGNPFVGFSVQKDGAGLPSGQGGFDHRYYYGRFDGASWNVNEMAFAGTKLYAGEDDYTGNIGLNPNDPNTVYISADVHPVTQTQLIGPDGVRHYEIFKGTTTDSGVNWQWSPVTFNSTEDNLRPILPDWDATNSALVWMQGTYTTFTNYDLAAVGLINPDVPGPELALAVDIGASGQQVQSGFQAFTRDNAPAGAEQSESFASPFAATGTDVTVTLGADVKFRDRGNNVAGPIGDIGDDFVFADDRLSLEFENLVEGDYQLVLYSHDRDFTQSNVTIIEGGAALGMLTPTEGVNPLVGLASARIPLAVDSSGRLDLLLNVASGEDAVLNGFELYAADQAPFVPVPPVLGDFDGNGMLELADYARLVVGMHTDVSALSEAEALGMGDINGDFKVNFRDFFEFRIAYDAVHGGGALAQALTIVPEPSTVISALVGWVLASTSTRPRPPSRGDGVARNASGHKQ